VRQDVVVESGVVRASHVALLEEGGDPLDGRDRHLARPQQPGGGELGGVVELGEPAPVVGGAVVAENTESRARYAEVLDAVVNDREEVVITRAGHEPVVIVSLDDFESLRETAYLLRSPANARRLLDAMERLESGSGQGA
jgi:antitoxin YefM